MFSTRTCLLFLPLYILFAAKNVKGCHNADNYRKKRSTTEETESTVQLREYFAACMEKKIPSRNTIYDWRTTVDFVVLDTLWHINSVQVYCSAFMSDTTECWQTRLSVFLKDNFILTKAKECVALFAEDHALRTNRFSNERSPNRRVPHLLLPSLRKSLDLSAFGSCLSNRPQTDISSLEYQKLSMFVKTNVARPCDVVFPEHITHSWPFVFAALTRSESPLRNRVLRCGERYYRPTGRETHVETSRRSQNLAVAGADSYWSAWSEWTNCSSSCKNVQSRQRHCLLKSNPSQLTKNCPGAFAQTKPCSNHSFPCANAFWSSWSDWSSCPVTCGRSRVVRRRRCQGSSGNGRSCIGRNIERKRCFGPLRCPEW